MVLAIEASTFSCVKSFFLAFSSFLLELAFDFAPWFGLDACSGLLLSSLIGGIGSPIIAFLMEVERPPVGSLCVRAKSCFALSLLASRTSKKVFLTWKDALSTKFFSDALLTVRSLLSTIFWLALGSRVFLSLALLAGCFTVRVRCSSTVLKLAERDRLEIAGKLPSDLSRVLLNLLRMTQELSHKAQCFSSSSRLVGVV